MVRNILLASALLLLTLPSHALSRLEASVDKNPVGRDESLILTVVANDEVASNRLDTALLQKDFLVGRTSISRSTRIINFASEKETRWQVLLTPKKSGQLAIGPFSIDGVKSNAIELDVSSDSQVNRDTQYLYMTTELSEPQVYVGEMTLYRVKLYLALDLQRGEISAPSLDGALIKQLGEDKNSAEIVDGRRFRVIERTYGIVPDKPGTLEIKAPVFIGDVLQPSPRNGGMFSFTESRPMQATAENLSLTVKEKPADWQGPWFVASLVGLTEEFPQTIDEFTVGVPITRTLSLVAFNVDETSLPNLDLTLPPELKGYPEKPERSSFLRDGQLVSQLKLTQAIVPMEAGSFVIPAVEVAWFNPHLGKREVARVPERTIRVVGPAGASAITDDAPKVTTDAGYWPWLSLLLALGWALTAVGWYSSAKNKPKPDHETEKHSDTEQSLMMLKRACEAADGNAMLIAALRYLSDLKGKPITLESARQLSPALHAALGQIQKACYSAGGNQRPDGRGLLLAITELNQQTSKHNPSSLKSLNP